MPGRTNPMTDKFYIPCDDCKFEEDSVDCQNCEFEQTLNSVICDTMGREYEAILGQLRSTDDKAVKSKLIARGLEIGRAHETIALRIELAAKDAEIERLKKLSKGNDTCLLELGEICGNIDAKDAEIERLKEELIILGESHRLIRKKYEPYMAEVDQLRTELAEERRLKDEERRELCETKTHNHPAGYTAEEYARDRGWGYLYEKEQGK
jgi:chromosome segregation ATPase